MSSGDLKSISGILSSLNDFLPSPVCTTELTKYSKLFQQHDELMQEIEKAGRLAKRSLKKKQEQLQNEIASSEEAVLQCIFNSIVKDLKPIIENQAESLSTVAPAFKRILTSLPQYLSIA